MFWVIENQGLLIERIRPQQPERNFAALKNCWHSLMQDVQPEIANPAQMQTQGEQPWFSESAP